MFRVIIYDENECEYVYRSVPFKTKEEAVSYSEFIMSRYSSSDYQESIIEVFPVTYASLIHSLSEYNEDICPIYTLKHMNVDECFEYGLDLSDESWNDFARMEVYEQVMLELKELKETFDKNTKDIKCHLTDLL